MLFIYWGWDTALNLNEESKDAETIPGKAGVYSTFILLGIYALVIFATESFAGIGIPVSDWATRVTRTTCSPSSVPRSSVTRPSPRSSITSCS